MIPIFYHDIVTPSGHPGDEVISALQKFIRRGETELAVYAAEPYPDRGGADRLPVETVAGDQCRGRAWGSPWPQWWWMPFTEAAGSSPGTAPIINCSSSTRCAICAPAGRERAPACLPVWLPGAYGGETPFPPPDYVYDMHTLTGQERGGTSTTSWSRPPVSGRGSGLRRRSWRRPSAGSGSSLRCIAEEEAQQDRT